MLTFQVRDTVRIRKLIGNVQFRQDSTLMYCDSAYHHVQENSIEAFSNVRIILSDSTNLRGDRLEYNGNTRVAEVYDNIVFIDRNSKLVTNRLTYWKEQKLARYTGGGVLTDPETRLTSEIGDYDGATREAKFKNKVKLRGKDYDLDADSLQYGAKTKIATFICPTYIHTKDNEDLFTERGYLKTKEKIAFLYQNPFFIDSNYCLIGDTIYYDNNAGAGWAHCNVQMTTKKGDIILYGENGRFNKRTRETFMADNPYLIQLADKDTMIVFADTLYAVDNKELKLNQLRAYPDVRVTMKDVQAIANFMVYDRTDSILTLEKDPVLWSAENQVSGDTIRLWMRDNKADSMNVINNAFVISKENDRMFNQIKGRLLRAKFRNNQLNRVRVFGNCESIYFVKDGDNLMGMNQSTSKELEILMKDNKPNLIKFYSKPIATLYPIADIKSKPNTLDGFRWRVAERPKKYF